MLQNSFQHIPGIGPQTERKLWQSNLTHWDCVTQLPHGSISPRMHQTLSDYIAQSKKHLTTNPAFFSDLLPSHLHWRLFSEYRHSAAFIDIETTGLTAWDAHITTIALYDGERIAHYIYDQNLDDFIDDINQYAVIVTFNGKSFDVPFIEQFFGTTLHQVHIDLRYVLKRLGYSGGLKRCEKMLGMDRGFLDSVDGYFAVLLWHDYRYNNNPRALETLLAYNIEDAVNLETLMVTAYNMNIENTPFSGTHRIPIPEKPVIPFKPDLATIHRIQNTLVSENDNAFI